MNNSNRGNKKSIGTTILILVVGLAYLAAKPKLEKWLGTELPGGNNNQAAVQEDSPTPDLTSNSTNSGSAAESNTSAGTSTKSQSDQQVLTRVGKDFKSKEGLVYRAGSSRGGHDHVLLHAKDNLSKPVHGVFDDKSQIFALADEAYKKIKSGSRDVQTSKQGSRTAYTVKMGRRIGYKGGRSGKQQGQPKLTRITLVLVEGNRVITAYPR